MGWVKGLDATRRRSVRPVWVAVCGIACVAPAAQAQSSVQLYGLMDLAANYVNNVRGDVRKSLDSSAYIKSRVGLRGSEDLGDGLRAIFQLEHNLNADTGVQNDAAKFWNRAAVVGFSHPVWGVVTVGHQQDFLAIDTPRHSSPLLIGGQGGGWQSAAGLQVDIHYGGWTYDNTVKWKNQTGDFKYGLMYGLGSETNHDKMGSAFLSWERGPWLVGVAWVRDNFSTQVVARQVTAGGVNYKNDTGMFWATLAQGKNPVTGASIKPLDVGYLYNITPLLAAGVSYAYVPVVNAVGARTHLSQPSLGTRYLFSKRTVVYASVASNRTSDKSVVRPSLDAPGGAPGPSTSDSQTGVRIGMSHSF